MAQRLQGLTLGFLDLDNEERFIKKGDYTNALNIRRFASNNGVAYPVKNVVGSLAVGNSLPSGDNTCIGQTTLEEANNIYFAIHNSNGNHGIYQYNTISDTVTTIVQDSYLNFSLSKYITGFNAVNNLKGDGILLYWTDNFNPPRKINVKRAILHNQGDYTNGYAENFSTGSDSIKARYYDAAKHPPTTPIGFTVVKDPTIGINNINNKTFQFRYRYIYDDGERSAYSPWSKLAYSPLLKSNDTSTVNSFDDQYNAIVLAYTPSETNNVKEIELTVREGNGGDEFLWETVDNVSSISTIRYYNNTVQTLVNTEDSLKPYDAVPLLAKAQEFYGDRLYYANTLDGYDQTNVEGRLTPVYNRGFDADNKEVINVSVTQQFLNPNILPIVTLDLSNVTIEEGKIVVIRFSFFTKEGDDNFWIGLTLTYAMQVGETNNSLLNNIAQLVRNYIYPSDVANRFTGVYTSIQYGNRIIKIYYAGEGVAVQNTGKLSSDSFAVLSVEGQPTHKGGSFHPYGIVYYDRAGRSSTVNKLDSPYVKFYSERSASEYEFGGAVDMALTIRNTPPVWATHWQPVYAGNKNVDEYLQYTCAGVYKGSGQTSNNAFDRVYLSLRNFQGSGISWKESTGALPSYNYTDGDRVRVWSYYDDTSDERVAVSGLLDFKVVDYVFLPKDDSNPIYDDTDATTKERTSGWFLILENPKIDGWDVSSIGSDITTETSNWYNGGADEGAYFEIYRPKSITEDLPYYEVGEKYEIGDAGLPTRYHKGSVRNQSETDISYTVVTAGFNIIDINQPFSLVKLIVGDTIQSVDASNNALSTHVIQDIGPISNGTQTRLYIDNSVAVTATTINLITSGDAAVLLTGGDSYYKPRVFFEGRNVVTFKANIVGVEDYYLNDFIDTGDSWDRGRANAFSKEQRQLRRPSTVWVSEPFSPDTNYNGLSAFNLSNTPYRDYPQGWGGIQVMKQNNQGLILWQEDKTSKILIDRNVLESAEGNQSITLSNRTLGQFIPYKGDYGVAQQPESLFGNDGDWYWTDIKRGAVIRLANDGITPISDYQARQYFYNTSRAYLSDYAKVKIVGGYDVENDEAIWTWPNVSTTTITVDGNSLIGSFPNGSISGGKLSAPVDINYKEPARLTHANDPRTWDERVENWEDRGGPIYNSEEIIEEGAINVSFDDIEGADSSINAYVTLNTTVGNSLTYGSILLGDGVLELPTEDPNYPIIEGETEQKQAGFTIAFYEPTNRWSTYYSFSPEMYASLNGNFFGFNNGGLHKFNQGSTYNNFFGVQYNSELSPVINDNPFDVKSFYANWIEGNYPWDITLTTNINGTSLLADNFVEKEGRWYQQLPFSNTGTTDSNTIGLGDVASINGTTITITGLNSGSGIFVGDDVFNTTGAIGGITAISGDEITLDSVSGLSAGDFVYVRRNGFIDGDRIRGVYAKLDMTNDETANEVELYSVDLTASKSFR